MAGRKPIPTNIKLLRGTAQPCRIRGDEAKPDSDQIAPPDDLSADALKHWATVVGQVKAAGVMTNLDVQALALYCESYAMWRYAHDEIKIRGPIVETPNGFPTQSPYMQIANKAFDQMQKMLTEFGMTPGSRTRVSGVKEKPKENRFSQF